ncbi:MAG: acyl-ACP--UDP-N-acetylglucosamine O-acyltransferase [Alphaproteobacteria bacterium]|nr:acyl-ACP--UDP-N-acetylglucosamine O-acyltransferase [Alphaproteobacteria bacterium]
MIHESAVISKEAIIGNNVEIGPFCFIGPGVEVGDGSIIHSHVVITGKTKIGSNNQIFPFASIGHQTQDLKFKGEESYIEIGDNNSIREYVTIHPGTIGGGLATKIGSNCLLMIGVHIAHDCLVGNNVIFANLATLAGHVIVEDHVVIGGLSAIHQHVRIGSHAMIGGCSGVERDVAPFATVSSERAYVAGMNLLGLKRRGFASDDILLLQKAFNKVFFENLTLDNAIEEVRSNYGNNMLVKQFLDFISEKSRRSLTMSLRAKST